MQGLADPREKKKRQKSARAGAVRDLCGPAAVPLPAGASVGPANNTQLAVPQGDPRTAAGTQGSGRSQRRPHPVVQVKDSDGPLGQTARGQGNASNRRTALLWHYLIQGLTPGQVDKARSAPAGPEKGEAT